MGWTGALVILTYLLSFVFRRSTLLAVSLAIAVSAASAWATSDDGTDPFFALSGSAASGFVPADDLRLAKSFALEPYGLTYERYQQHFGPADVAGAQVTLFRDASGRPVAVVGAHFKDLAASSTVRLSAAAASSVAEREFGPATSRDAALMIDPESGRYFFRVDSRRFAARWMHWVDAENGGVLKRYGNLQEDHGTGVKADSKAMTGISTLHNASGHGAPDEHWDLFSTDNRQHTFDKQNSNNPFLYYSTDSDNHWTLVTADRSSPGQPAPVDAHYYANASDDYFLNTYGLDWIGDCGYVRMQSVAHYGNNYANAFWNGTYTVYGDGDGDEYREFSGSLDVVAHEHTHGVTECTSNLVYEDQSGALNESFSDMLGNSAEFFANEPPSSNCVRAAGQDVCADWWIAEDIYLPADAKPGFRNMADPEEDASDTLGIHPDHFTEFVLTTADNGGVHINSAISNHAYYLAVNGGINASCAAPATHRADHCSDGDTQDNNLNVAGIGLADAQAIFFLAFTGLPDSASFCQARLATEATAASLFGASSQELISTRDAWVAVGLTNAECSLPAPSPSPSATPTATATATPTATATATATPTPTATATATATATPTPTATASATATPTPTATPTATATATATATPTPTATATAAATATPSPTPTPAPTADTDGDGFTDVDEGLIGTNPGYPCGNPGWPVDLLADNRLNIGDLNSFLFPLRGNGSFNKFGHPVPDPDDSNIARWNLLPDAIVNIGDLNALNPAVLAPTARPPMFGGQPAFFTDVGNGVGGCPFPP